MNKVNTDFKNVITFTGWWVAKRIIGLESYLVEGDIYKITHQTIGDASDKYYCIECAAHPNGGMWVLAERGEYLGVETTKVGGESISLAISEAKAKIEKLFGKTGNLCLTEYIEKLTPDSVKPERIIDIPPNTEYCHSLDLERVQYVGIADKDGHYLVTLGWTESIKLNEDIYPRTDFVKKWKAYHGQEV